MWANPDEKLIHTKCMTVGDEHCDFETVLTSEEDRESFFGESRDWSGVDPRLAEYYEEEHGKK